MQFNALASIFVCHGKPKVNLPAFWQGFPAKIYYVLEYNGADQTEKIQPVHFLETLHWDKTTSKKHYNSQDLSQIDIHFLHYLY